MKILIIIFFLLLTLVSLGQSVHISGTVIDKETQHRLSGASIQIVKTKYATRAEDDGNFYIANVPIGKYEIIIKHIGYLTHKSQINLTSDTSISVSIVPFSIELDPVTIQGTSRDQSYNASPNITKFTGQQLRNIPFIGGERDVARALFLTPGVKTDNEASAGLFVRGGSSDQNLYLLDNVPLYKSSHFFGFLSPFNSDVISQTELYKGGFPARFGGRLSSVLDTKVRSGSTQKIQASGSVGILTSRLAISVPLIKDRASLLIAGRRSYFDVFTRLFPGTGTSSGPNYYFYDFNSKLTFRLSSHTSLAMFAYQDQDQLQAKSQNDLEDFRYKQTWFSRIAGIAINTQVNRKWINTFELNLSNYSLEQFTQQQQQQLRTDFNFENSLKTMSVQNTIEWEPSTYFQSRLGGVGVRYRIQPSNLLYSNQNEVANNSLDTTTMNEISTFWENEINTTHLQIKAGFRYATYQVKKGGQFYFPEPRLSISYKTVSGETITGTYARMNQPLQLLTNPGFGLPVDLWFPIRNSIKPQQSDQFTLAYNRAVYLSKGKTVDLLIEGYYKNMRRIISYRDGYSSANFTSVSQGSTREWETIMAVGKGNSYGIEALIQKKQGRFTGWLGYTLSWTRNQFDDLNKGKPFFARQDRRHDVSAVCNLQINKRWSMNSTWIYQTGQPVTLPQAVYSQTEFDFLANRFNSYGPVLYTYGERNSYRMKANHRLDLSLQRKTTHKWGVGQIDLSFYNVYNRQNPYFYYLAAGNRVKSVSLFQIIPSIGYTFNVYTGQ